MYQIFDYAGQKAKRKMETKLMEYLTLWWLWPRLIPMRSPKSLRIATSTAVTSKKTKRKIQREEKITKKTNEWERNVELKYEDEPKVGEKSKDVDCWLEAVEYFLEIIFLIFIHLHDFNCYWFCSTALPYSIS